MKNTVAIIKLISFIVSMALSLYNSVVCSNTVSIQCECKIVNGYFVKCLKTKKITAALTALP